MDTGGSVHLTVTGPLAPYESALRVELTRVGYAPWTAALRAGPTRTRLSAPALPSNRRTRTS
jgi:hypothetical protein